MQHDGNLVIYKKYNTKDYGNPIWASGTNYSPHKRPFHLKMQNDGNVVMYSMDKKVVWTTNTPGKGERPYSLIMQGDGNLVVYDRNKNAIWASNTMQSS